MEMMEELTRRGNPCEVSDRELSKGAIYRAKKRLSRQGEIRYEIVGRGVTRYWVSGAAGGAAEKPDISKEKYKERDARARTLRWECRW